MAPRLVAPTERRPTEVDERPRSWWIGNDASQLGFHAKILAEKADEAWARYDQEHSRYTFLEFARPDGCAETEAAFRREQAAEQEALKLESRAQRMAEDADALRVEYEAAVKTEHPPRVPDAPMRRRAASRPRERRARRARSGSRSGPDSDSSDSDGEGPHVGQRRRGASA